MNLHRPAIVVYDACVLFPAPLRDLLMRVALADLCRARWTDRIHEEWIGNVLAKRPDLHREDLERTRTLMNRGPRESLVSGFEHLESKIELPDTDDRHVVAAAIHRGATGIVTFNLKDFPARVLESYDLAARHPDQFLSELFDLEPYRVAAVAAEQRQSLKSPPKNLDQFLEILARQSLPLLVGRLRASQLPL